MDDNPSNAEESVESGYTATIENIEPSALGANSHRIATDGGTTELADQVQDAQDIVEELEDDVPAETLEVLETVDDDLEQLEDAIEDGDGTLPEDFEADVQSTQDSIDDLQENLNLTGADRQLITKAESLDDSVETIEDRLGDTHDRYGVKVDTDPVEFFDQESPTAKEILTRFGKNNDDKLVQKDTENTYSGDDEVPLGGPGIERFTSEPRTPGNA